MTTATTLGAIVMTPLLCKGLLGAVVPVDAAGIAKSTIQVRYVDFIWISAPICITCVYDFNDEHMSDLPE